MFQTINWVKDDNLLDILHEIIINELPKTLTSSFKHTENIEYKEKEHWLIFYASHN